MVLNTSLILSTSAVVARDATYLSNLNAIVTSKFALENTYPSIEVREGVLDGSPIHLELELMLNFRLTLRGLSQDVCYRYANKLGYDEVPRLERLVSNLFTTRDRELLRVHAMMDDYLRDAAEGMMQEGDTEIDLKILENMGRVRALFPRL